MEQRSTILTLRVIAAIVIAAGLIAFIVQIRGVRDLTALTIIPSLTTFVLAGGIGSILFGIAAQLDQRQTGPAEMIRNLVRVQAQVTELATKVDDLGLSVDRLARTRIPEAIVHESAPRQPTENSEDLIAPLRQTLQEILDVSLLTDEQRRDRWQQLYEERKLAEVRRAIDRIERQQWGQAEQILAAVEAEWPGDATALAARKQLEQARREVEANSILAGETEVESEMSLGRWDEAFAAARQLCADFPANQRASALMARVEREKSIFTETTVARLFEEIRHDIDRRVWRRALLHAQKLLEKFPDHHKSEKIRQQLKTIQDNAEIEERQEEEVRIGELIRARRFAEAVQLSEDLLRRFPMSPQAEAIEKMLPRIHQLAEEAEKEAGIGSPFRS